MIGTIWCPQVQPATQSRSPLGGRASSSHRDGRGPHAGSGGPEHCHALADGGRVVRPDGQVRGALVPASSWAERLVYRRYFPVGRIVNSCARSSYPPFGLITVNSAKKDPTSAGDVNV
jgi:hypothetical protein